MANRRLQTPYERFMAPFSILYNWVSSQLRVLEWRIGRCNPQTKTKTAGAPHFLPLAQIYSILVAQKISAHHFCMINNYNFISLFSQWNLPSSILEFILPLPPTHTILKSYKTMITFYSFFQPQYLSICIELKL